MNRYQPVARITSIKYIDGKDWFPAGEIGPFDMSGEMGSHNSELINLSNFSIKTMTEQHSYIIRPIHENSGLAFKRQATVNMTLRIGDIMINGPDTVSSLEFFIGGRTGINKRSGIVITDERNVVEFQHETHMLRDIYKSITNGGLWTNAGRYRGDYFDRAIFSPNNGASGIKG